MDRYDFIALVGVGGIGYGVWRYDPAAACIVVGAILLLVGAGAAIWAS